MNVKRLSFCLVLKLFTVSAMAQMEGTLLFAVKHPQLGHVSYLFGTNHAFSKSFVDGYPVVLESLLQTERVVLEIDLSLLENAVDEIVRKRSQTTSWKKYFSPDDLALVKSILKRDDEVFDRFTPAELHAVLFRYMAIKGCKTRTPEDPNATLDDYFGLKGRENGKEVIGLETASQQLSFINEDVAGMPVKIHRRKLQAVVDKIKANSSAECGRYDAYSQMNYDYQYNSACNNAVMLIERSAAWMEVIPDFLTTKSCFIAVGLNHLRFRCGLITLLREKGFVIEPVAMKKEQ